jgi:spore photoproduct lyase
MIRGLDGKMRYPRPLRVSLYRKVYDRLKDHHPGLFIYFCMEPPWVWEAVMGEAPASNADLDYRFAKSLYERFPCLRIPEPNPDAYE